MTVFEGSLTLFKAPLDLEEIVDKIPMADYDAQMGHQPIPSYSKHWVKSHGAL